MVKTVLYLKIQFNISHLFAHGLNVKQFYLTHVYWTLSSATTPGQSSNGSHGNKWVLEPHNVMFSCHIQDNRRGDFTFWRDAVGVFYSRMDCAFYCDVVDVAE